MSSPSERRRRALPSAYASRIIGRTQSIGRRRRPVSVRSTRLEPGSPNHSSRAWSSGRDPGERRQRGVAMAQHVERRLADRRLHAMIAHARGDFRRLADEGEKCLHRSKRVRRKLLLQQDVDVPGAERKPIRVDRACKIEQDAATRPHEQFIWRTSAALDVEVIVAAHDRVLGPDADEHAGFRKAPGERSGDFRPIALHVARQPLIGEDGEAQRGVGRIPRRPVGIGREAARRDQREQLGLKERRCRAAIADMDKADRPVARRDGGDGRGDAHVAASPAARWRCSARSRSSGRPRSAQYSWIGNSPVRSPISRPRLRSSGMSIARPRGTRPENCGDR